MDKMYEEFKENVKNVIKPLGKKESMSASELEAFTNGLIAIHKINQICEEESYEDMGTSQRGMSRDYRHGEDPYRRWEIMSYGDGRMSRGTSMGYPYYPQTTDYSRHSIKDRAISKLERMMDESGSDYERQKIKEMIRRVETVD